MKSSRGSREALRVRGSRLYKLTTDRCAFLTGVKVSFCLAVFAVTPSLIAVKQTLVRIHPYLLEALSFYLCYFTMSTVANNFVSVYVMSEEQLRIIALCYCNM